MHGALPDDLWLAIAARMAHAPHAVFRLMMTNRRMRALFSPAGEHGKWWQLFFECVREYQAGLKHSRFLKRMSACHERLAPFGDVGPRLCAAILRCIFAPRCEACGARYGHRVMLPFAVRVCAPCLRAHCISNHALERRFGVEFSAFLDTYMLSGGLLVPIDAFRNRMGQAIARMSEDACDTRAPTHVQRKLVFFWRPDVEHALGASLETLVPLHTLRVRAAQRLTAVVRRKGLHAFMACVAQRTVLSADMLGVARGVWGRMYESTRHCMPEAVPEWMPGVGMKRPRAEHAQRIVGYTSRTLSATVHTLSWFPQPKPTRSCGRI